MAQIGAPPVAYAIASSVAAARRNGAPKGRRSASGSQAYPARTTPIGYASRVRGQLGSQSVAVSTLNLKLLFGPLTVTSIAAPLSRANASVTFLFDGVTSV